MTLECIYYMLLFVSLASILLYSVILSMLQVRSRSNWVKYYKCSSFNYSWFLVGLGMPIWLFCFYSKFMFRCDLCVLWLNLAGRPFYANLDHKVLIVDVVIMFLLFLYIVYGCDCNVVFGYVHVSHWSLGANMRHISRHSESFSFHVKCCAFSIIT